MAAINLKSLTALGTTVLLLSSTPTVNATAHVFVLAKEGVWLASDSLNYHNDGQKVTASHVCKVAISKGQLFFNLGFFKDVDLLVEQESALPFASMDITRDSVFRLLTPNHMDMSKDPRHQPNQLVVNTGIVQVENSVFRANMISETDTQKLATDLPLRFGVPFGYGGALDRVREEAAHDPAVAARIAASPKKELLKILEEEAIMQNDRVQGPFTVLLLHPDGTVSDFSDQQLCTIPEGARHH